MAIKSEAVFTHSTSLRENGLKEKDKDVGILSVSPAGEKEFTVATTSKPQIYQATDADVAARWVKEIQTMLENCRNTNTSTRPTSNERT